MDLTLAMPPSVTGEPESERAGEGRAGRASSDSAGACVGGAASYMRATAVSQSRRNKGRDGRGRMLGSIRRVNAAALEARRCWRQGGWPHSQAEIARQCAASR